MNNDIFAEYKNIWVARSLIRKSIYKFHSLSKEIQDIEIDYYQFKSIEKAEPFLTLPEVFIFCTKRLLHKFLSESSKS